MGVISSVPAENALDIRYFHICQMDIVWSPLKYHNAVFILIYKYLNLLQRDVQMFKSERSEVALNSMSMCQHTVSKGSLKLIEKLEKIGAMSMLRLF